MSQGKTGDIITFAQFEERNLLINYQNLVDQKSISDSINESSTEDNSDDESISTNSLEDNWDGKHLHMNILARYAILITRD